MNVAKCRRVRRNVRAFDPGTHFPERIRIARLAAVLRRAVRVRSPCPVQQLAAMMAHPIPSVAELTYLCGRSLRFLLSYARCHPVGHLVGDRVPITTLAFRILHGTRDLAVALVDLTQHIAGWRRRSPPCWRRTS